LRLLNKQLVFGVYFHHSFKLQCPRLSLRLGDYELFRNAELVVYKRLKL
jgi:hypothetical protein